MNTATPSPCFLRKAVSVSLLLASTISAQVIVGPVTSLTSATPGLQDEDTTRGSLADVSSALPAGLPLFRRGPLSVRPHLEYRYMYVWNLQAVPGLLRNSSIQHITPGALLEIGKHWRLDLVPTWTYYSDRFFTDTFSHSARLTGSTKKDTWSAGVSASYSLAHLALVETARQMRNEEYLVSANGSRKLGSRTWYDGLVSYSARYTEPVNPDPGWTESDWVQWTTTHFIRYQFTPNFSLSAGAELGYAEVSVGDNMETITPSAQINWQATEKILLKGQAGTEQRKFLDGSREKLNSPTYSASLSYRPFKVTIISFDASRRVSASYFANEITRSKSYGVTVSQRLLTKLFLTVGMSEHESDFLIVRKNTAPRRNDRYRTFSSRLSTVFLERMVVAVHYQTSRNFSDDTLYAFRTEQTGLELSYRF